MIKPANIYIVASKFNYIVTERLYNSAVKAYIDSYKARNLPQSIWVPGAVELPLMASWVIEEKQPDAIVCLGAVVKGESSHFDYVCQQVSHGCQQVSLQYKIPVTFGVLLTYSSIKGSAFL